MFKKISRKQLLQIIGILLRNTSYKFLLQKSWLRETNQGRYQGVLLKTVLLFNKSNLYRSIG